MSHCWQHCKTLFYPSILSFSLSLSVRLTFSLVSAPCELLPAFWDYLSITGSSEVRSASPVTAVFAFNGYFSRSSVLRLFFSFAFCWVVSFPFLIPTGFPEATHGLLTTAYLSQSLASFLFSCLRGAIKKSDLVMRGNKENLSEWSPTHDALIVFSSRLYTWCH